MRLDCSNLINRIKLVYNDEKQFCKDMKYKDYEYEEIKNNKKRSFSQEEVDKISSLLHIKESQISYFFYQYS